jgi:hypothetical protein
MFHAYLIECERSNGHAAGGLGVRKGGPSLAHRRSGSRQFVVWTPTGGMISQHLGGLGQSFLGPAAVLSGGEYPVSLQLPALGMARR